MKYFNLILISILFILTGCTTTERKQETSSLNTTEDLTKGTISTESDCSIDRFLKSKDILTDAILIYKGEKQPADDVGTMDIFRKLDDPNDEAFIFYMIVIDKILDKTDGALTEIAMSSVYNFIETKPDVFFNFFNNNSCFIEKYNMSMTDWAEHYAYYISMACDLPDHNYRECIEEKLDQLHEKCPSCSIEPFATKVKGFI